MNKKKITQKIVAMFAALIIYGCNTSIVFAGTGYADSSVEILLDEARETDNEENLYREARDGAFSEDVLINVIDRGYLTNHVDEFKILGLLPQSYGLDNNHKNGKENGSVAEDTNTAYKTDEKSKDKNENQPGGKNQGSNTSVGMDNPGSVSQEGNAGLSNPNASDTSHSDDPNQKDTAQEPNTNMADADKNGNTGMASSSQTGDLASDKTDTNDNLDDYVAADELNYPDELIQKVEVTDMPTGSTYGKAVITDKNNKQVKVLFDEEWLEKIQSEKISYLDHDNTDNESTSEKSNIHIDSKMVLILWIIFILLCLIAVIVTLIRRRQMKNIKSKIKKVNL